MREILASAGDERAVTVTFVVVPGFMMLPLTTAIDALRLANRECLCEAWRWEIVTPDGAPTESSCGLPINPTATFAELHSTGVALVLSSWQPERGYQPELRQWLRRMDRRRALIGCVETGAFVLARAGLLGDSRVALHHESVPAFEEEFGKAFSARALYYDRQFACQGRRLSSAGGIATLDMLLALFARRFDESFATRIAGMLNYRRQPAEPVAQGDARGGLRDTSLWRVNPLLSRCIELMQSHLEDPLPVAQLCAVLAIPDWQLRRLFRRYLGCSPADYYLGLRLSRAHDLLAHGQAPIKQIALACGFADTPSFSRAFKRHSGRRPSDCRGAGSPLLRATHRVR